MVPQHLPGKRHLLPGQPELVANHLENVGATGMYQPVSYVAPGKSMRLQKAADDGIDVATQCDGNPAGKFHEKAFVSDPPGHLVYCAKIRTAVHVYQLRTALVITTAEQEGSCRVSEKRIPGQRPEIKRGRKV